MTKEEQSEESSPASAQLEPAAVTKIETKEDECVDEAPLDVLSNVLEEDTTEKDEIVPDTENEIALNGSRPSEDTEDDRSTSNEKGEEEISDEKTKIPEGDDDKCNDGYGGEETPATIEGESIDCFDVTAPEEMAPFAPIDNSIRTLSHQKLRAYESKRRKAYRNKLTSSSLYWRSFRELMNNSMNETARAERIVLARVAATEAYATHMAAIYEDDLDDVTHLPTIPDRKPNLLSRNLSKFKKSGASTKGPGPVDVEGAALGGASTFKLGDNLTSPDSHSFNEMFLNSVIESHKTLADRYTESASNIREQVSSELTSLKDQLEEQLASMEFLGDAILEELKAAEDEVALSWNNYYVAATEVLSGGDSSMINKVSKRRGASSEIAIDDIAILTDCTDIWILEMHYRMAVAFLSACWDKCSAELSKLFASMKETECSRRLRLRELLILFLRNEERLWMSLPSTVEPLLKSIVGKSVDRSEIEENVQNSIKSRAQYIQREELMEKPMQSEGPGLSHELAKEGNFELASPLVSELLHSVKVVQKKDSGLMRSWKTCLAVITADSYLQLFELPPAHSKHIQVGSAPEVAFHALVPSIEVPSKVNPAFASTAGITPKLWLQDFVPTDSILLPNCVIQHNKLKNDPNFEITEQLSSTGATKLFSKVTTKKFYFKTRTAEETLEWIAALKAPK